MAVRGAAGEAKSERWRRLLLFDLIGVRLFVGRVMFSTKFAVVLLAVAGAAVASPVPEAAPGLLWEETTLALETDGGPAAHNVTFRFRNTGDQPVVIRSVKTTCGCTVTQPDKTIYAPGESGLLPVTHKPKPGAGVRQYRIFVKTDESGGRLHTLLLRVTNSPRLSVLPRLVTWEQGEAREPKSLQVRLKKDDPVKLTGVRADRDVLDVQIIDGAEPGQQTLVVTPKPEAGVVPGRVRVQLLTEPPLPPSMDHQFFIVLR